MATEADVKAALLTIYAGLGRADPEKSVANMVKTWATHCGRFTAFELSAAAQAWITSSDSAPTLNGFLELLHNGRDSAPGRREPEGCKACRGSGRRSIYAWLLAAPGAEQVRGTVYVAACDCQAGQAIRNYGFHGEVLKRLEQHSLIARNEGGWPCVWEDSAEQTILQVQDAHRPPQAGPRATVNKGAARTWVAMAERGAREAERERKDEYEHDEGDWR